MQRSEESASSPDRRRTRWDAHRAQRRRELIAAAVEAISAHGADTDMEQVAAAAGVSKPVLYRYFADKAELWQAVGERVAEVVVDAVAPAIANVAAERDLVATTVDAYLSAIERRPDLYEFLVHVSRAPRMPHIIASSGKRVASDLARVIGDRLRGMGLDSGAAEPWAYGIVGLVQTIGDWWITHGRPISRKALTEYVTTLLWDGLAGIRAAADLPNGLAYLERP